MSRGFGLLVVLVVMTGRLGAGEDRADTRSPLHLAVLVDKARITTRDFCLFGSLFGVPLCRTVSRGRDCTGGGNSCAFDAGGLARF